MTDTFLDEQQARNLHQDLTTIATNTGELLRIARRETSPPGGRAARNPQVPGSRPPLNLGVLSVSHEMHNCLAGWAQCLKDDTGIELPTIPDEKGLAQHLRYHHHRVAQQPWAADAAGEIGHWANVLHSVTAPPTEKRLDDYTDAQRDEGMQTAKVDAGLCAELVAEYTNGKHAPTPDKIREWGRRKQIESFGPKTRRVYSVQSVLDLVRHAQVSRA